MKQLVDLLQEKNHFLEKFYALNLEELKKFLSGNFDGLDYFYQTRENILEMIKYIDSQVESVSMQTANQEIDVHIKAQIEAALKAKELYVKKIVEQDIDILACIDNAKSNIIRELQNIKKGRKAIGGYKSPSQQRRLDEQY